VQHLVEFVDFVFAFLGLPRNLVRLLRTLPQVIQHAQHVGPHGLQVVTADALLVQQFLVSRVRHRH